MSLYRNLKRECEDEGETEEKKKCLENSKNWNDLPVELKVMCIEKMDILTRVCLRETSSTEKQLVERQAVVVEYLEIDDTTLTYDALPFHVIVEENGREPVKSEVVSTFEDDEDYDRSTKLLSFVLKRAKIERMKVCLCLEKHTKHFSELMKKNTPVRVKNIEIGEKNTRYMAEELVDILKNCSPAMNSIKVRSWENLPVGNLLKLPVVKTAKSLFFDSRCLSPALGQILKMYAKTKPPIGTRFKSVYRNSYMSRLQVDFDHLILEIPLPEHLDKSYVLRTDDPLKHILIYNDAPPTPSEEFPLFDTVQYFSAIVIPADTDFFDDDALESILNC